MKSYLVTIITASVCVGIYNVVSPGGCGIGKYSKMIGMLIVLCVIVSPMKNLMDLLNGDELQNIKDSIIDSGDNEESEYGKIFNDYLSSFSVEELKGAIEKILLEEYGIPNSECNVTISTVHIEGNLKVSHIKILLSGKSIFKNPYIIEDYFKKMLDCNCDVLIE